MQTFSDPLPTAKEKPLQEKSNETVQAQALTA